MPLLSWRRSSSRRNSRLNSKKLVKCKLQIPNSKTLAQQLALKSNRPNCKTTKPNLCQWSSPKKPCNQPSKRNFPKFSLLWISTLRKSLPSLQITMKFCILKASKILKMELCVGQPTTQGIRIKRCRSSKMISIMPVRLKHRMCISKCLKTNQLKIAVCHRAPLPWTISKMFNTKITTISKTPETDTS